MILSIITICYNDKQGFDKTAISIASQTFRNFEWIVIDGGSTDGCVELQQKYSNQMAYYISEPDKGIYNAMNKGVMQAKGEYCLFINSGDIICSPKALERVFKHDLHGDVVACDMFADIGKKLYAYNEAPLKLNFFRLVIGSIGHQSTLIRTSLLKENPYREDFKIASDWAFWWEILMNQHKKYQVINIPIAVFDTNGVSESEESKDLMFEERRRILCQYFNPQIVDHITKNCGPISAINGSYMYEMERRFHRVSIRTISSIFAHIFRYGIKVYKNLKYRG